MRKTNRHKVRLTKSVADSSVLLYLIASKLRKFYLRFKRGIFCLSATIIVCIILFIQAQNFIRAQNINLTGLVYNYLSYPIHYFKEVANSCMKSLFIYYYGYSVIETAEVAQNIEAYMVEIAALKLENTQLKEAINFVDTLKYDYISARIVYADISRYDARMLVNAGSRVGVKEGCAVVNSAGLVGRVGEVFEDFSTIYIIGDNDLRIAAITINSGINLIIRGNGEQLLNNILHVEYGNTKADILEDGEMVVTSGYGNAVPYGINIGKIYKKGQDFIVRPNIDIKKLGVVNIVMRK